jgi:glycyl-tRNA synthetase beta subunit
MLYIIIEIPNIPFKEGEKAIKYLTQIKNFKVNETFIWKDGLGVFWKDTPLIVKGPKISEEEKLYIKNKNYEKLNKTNEIACKFIEKHLTLYNILPNKENFYEENNILYFTTYQQFDLMKLVKNIPWIKPMKILNDFVTRPVKNIYLSYEVASNSTYGGILPKQQDFTIDSFKEFYKKAGVLVDFQEKIRHLENLKIFNKEIIDSFYNKNLDLIHNTSIPHMVFIPLKDKYKSIPNYLIDFIISFEQRVISAYENCQLIGFNFIIDREFKHINIESFSIVIDSRLEDLKISYERDKKIVEFNSSYHNPQLFNLIYQLKEYFNFHLNEEILDFIIKNLKNDFNTTLVEEYYSLGGILSGLIYKDTVEDYNEDILNGFLSLNGIIKNNYGLLIYISEKLNFLIGLGESQLATSTKDPFATKDTVDKILTLLKENNCHIPYDLMTHHLKEFFKKRLELLNKKEN